MENASKALLIAASVLIVILVITVGMKISTSADGIKGVATDTGDAIKDATDIAIGKLDGEQDNDDKIYIEDDDSYVKYYADVDGDGNVDGVIYADLAIGCSGEFGSNRKRSIYY